MIQLKTSETKVLDRERLTRIGDLINIEGPILSVFQDENNSDFYLFDWADSDNYVNRWLVYKVNPENIKNFITNRTSYRELFISSLNSEYYYIDIDNDLLDSDFILTKITTLPENYIPLNENRFDKKDARNIDQVIFAISNPSKEHFLKPKVLQVPLSTFKKTQQKRYSFDASTKVNNAIIRNNNPFSVNLRNRENVKQNKRFSEFA